MTHTTVHRLTIDRDAGLIDEGSLPFIDSLMFEVGAYAMTDAAKIRETTTKRAMTS